MRIVATMEPDQSICGIPVFKAALPRWLRAVALPNIQTIFYSRRLKTQDSISKAVRHEYIHLILDNGKHGREFKRWCLRLGLDPKEHV